MWLMLQQDTPDDFVIATGEQHSVREFVETAAAMVGIRIAWEGKGIEERGIVEGFLKDPPVAAKEPHPLTPGQTIIRIDERYFRPTEVETLLGNPAKAKEKLGWQPRITFADLVREMVDKDLEQARSDDLLRRKGFQIKNYYE